MTLPGTSGASGTSGGGEAFGYDNESPRHRVYLEPYELADRPVSNGEYKRVHRRRRVHASRAVAGRGLGVDQRRADHAPAVLVPRWRHLAAVHARRAGGGRRRRAGGAPVLLRGRGVHAVGRRAVPGGTPAHRVRVGARRRRPARRRPLRRLGAFPPAANDRNLSRPTPNTQHPTPTRPPLRHRLGMDPQRLRPLPPTTNPPPAPSANTTASSWPTNTSSAAAPSPPRPATSAPPTATSSTPPPAGSSPTLRLCRSAKGEK